MDAIEESNFDERYRELYARYQSLKDELDVLQREGDKISAEIHRAIDHAKIRKVFQFIAKKSD